MEESPDERGAKKHRFDVGHIYRNKGAAHSYLAKYISQSMAMVLM